MKTAEIDTKFKYYSEYSALAAAYNACYVKTAEALKTWCIEKDIPIYGDIGICDGSILIGCVEFRYYENSVDTFKMHVESGIFDPTKDISSTRYYTVVARFVLDINLFNELRAFVAAFIANKSALEKKLDEYDRQ